MKTILLFPPRVMWAKETVILQSYTCSRMQYLEGGANAGSLCDNNSLPTLKHTLLGTRRDARLKKPGLRGSVFVGFRALSACATAGCARCRQQISRLRAYR